MTRLEALGVLVLDVRVYARQYGLREVDALLVEERLAYWQGPDGLGTVKGSAAGTPGIDPHEILASATSSPLFSATSI